MKTTELGYADIASVVDGRLVGTSQGLYKVFEAVLGVPVSTLTPLWTADRVRAELLRQHPAFGSAALGPAVTRAVDAWEADPRHPDEAFLDAYVDEFVLPVVGARTFTVQSL